MLVKIPLYILAIVAVLAAVVIVTDRLIRSRGYSGPVSDHFDGQKFFNDKSSAAEKEPRERMSIFKWMLTREQNVWTKREVHQTKPVRKVEGAEIQATFINHATVLIQTEGLNIITDPIYSKRASPFSFIGPERFADPGVAFEDLPKIDVVLLSHNHYDHLDLPTLRKLVARDHPLLLVPLGNKEFLASRGMPDARELDWWDTYELSETMSFEFLPSQHFSARGLSDRNKTLWGGYAIRTPHGDIYFAGDTGWGPFVQKIKERFPNGFRLGLLPIGAFSPRAVMREVHVSPDEAIEMQRTLNVRDAMAIHFGTFKLASDGQDEPAKRIHSLLEGTEAQEHFQVLPNGGMLKLP